MFEGDRRYYVFAGLGDVIERPLLQALRRAIVTLEENALAAGAGSGIGELLAAAGLPVSLLHLGIPDRFIEHGTRAECLQAAGLDAASISRKIESWWVLQTEERVR